MLMSFGSVAVEIGSVVIKVVVGSVVAGGA